MQRNRNPQPQYHAGRRHFLIRAAALSATAAVAPAAHAALAPTTSVTVEQRGGEILVDAHAEVHAALDTTWLTLADYDRLADFIPGMAQSRTVSRTGAAVLVEQKAVATFGPFSQTLSLLLAVDEAPNQSISASIIRGDFRRFDSRYDVVALDAERTRVDYRATLDPTVPVPPLFGVAVMRSQIRKQFEALVAEIDRRGARA
jgi:ribosome-associated toxin RatA of RatAB toxin-antitoxin module